MNLITRLNKLREDKKLIVEALRQAEAKAAIRQHKQAARAKIILGAAMLSLPAGEREALLPMVLDRLSERDRRFLADHLAKDQPAEDAPPPAGLN